MKYIFYIFSCLFLLSILVFSETIITYPIVDTGQKRSYNNKTEISFPKKGNPFFGNDAMFKSNSPSYTDNKDGTITDNVTGLMWQKKTGDKITLKQANAKVKKLNLAGHHDWRLPTIKELYSLILFTGIDPNPYVTSPKGLTPFIDTKFFTFKYGTYFIGERIIDCQYASSTKYVSTTMQNNPTLFGVNFADGCLKGYPLISTRTKEDSRFYFIFVRGNKVYGQNKFVDLKNGTIKDQATGLTWTQMDSGFLANSDKSKEGMNWVEALEYAEKLNHGGHSDWRLPNIKELQSIVDYTRSPKTTQSPAIHPLFKLTKIKCEDQSENYAFYWSSTSHLTPKGAQSANYIAFGEALSYIKDKKTEKATLMNAHGAGAQRSDLKTGDPADDPSEYRRQGDVRRINNYVLCVRGGNSVFVEKGPKVIFKYRKTPPLLKRLDKNNDGKLSQSEFDGPLKYFKLLDKNSDGQLTLDELPKGSPRKRKR